MTPMGRLGRPDELNGLAVFLASEASSFMTGSMVLCDVGRFFSVGVGRRKPANGRVRRVAMLSIDLGCSSYADKHRTINPLSLLDMLSSAFLTQKIITTVQLWHQRERIFVC